MQVLLSACQWNIQSCRQPWLFVIGMQDKYFNSLLWSEVTMLGFDYWEVWKINQELSLSSLDLLVQPEYINTCRVHENIKYMQGRRVQLKSSSSITLSDQWGDQGKAALVEGPLTCQKRKIGSSFASSSPAVVIPSMDVRPTLPVAKKRKRLINPSEPPLLVVWLLAKRVQHPFHWPLLSQDYQQQWPLMIHYRLPQHCVSVATLSTTRAIPLSFD